MFRMSSLRRKEGLIRYKLLLKKKVMLESLFTGNNAKKADHSEESLFKLMTYNSSFNPDTYNRLLLQLELVPTRPSKIAASKENVASKHKVTQPVSSKGIEDHASKRLERKRKSHPMNLNNQSLLDNNKSKQIKSG